MWFAEQVLDTLISVDLQMHVFWENNEEIDFLSHSCHCSRPNSIDDEAADSFQLEGEMFNEVGSQNQR